MCRDFDKHLADSKCTPVLAVDACQLSAQATHSKMGLVEKAPNIREELACQLGINITKRSQLKEDL